MNSKLLVVNAGSSSIKMQLFEKNSLNVIANVLTERIFLTDSKITIKYNNQVYEKTLILSNHQIAVEQTLTFLSELKVIENIDEIISIGFRVVHGGPYFNKSTILNNQVIELINQCSIYAPLHNPGAVQAINAFKEVMPNATLIASFDTSFHSSIPLLNSIYPIPYKWTQKYNIKKYGFHGISHNFIKNKVSEILNIKKPNIISLHIGSGASICAIKNGLSIDTSMGFTPLAGIMMGTRTGDIDPSIIEFICKNEKLSVEEVTNILNKQSGLLGVSEFSNDTRDIQRAIAEGNKQAQFSNDLYVQKIVDYVADYANKLENKIDAIVFTAGVGENQPELRKEVCEKLFFKKIKIDQKINNDKVKDWSLISTNDSEVKIFVIRTNEELMIAQDMIKLL
ncbi:acetate/propionate family kinase [Mycoplasma sp. 1018B]|uniref:acetate/propionate family kinase n=1 Tax=Mycoplasma sp. 1018B TaxID=2967302 RepID=UPI00211CA5DB|nr:acetate/propionate family kinase [Mycoplasma sp. 1018B]UUM19216.1 acetate/propionate family kinase [Mycoplasma sp. 1018B]